MGLVVQMPDGDSEHAKKRRRDKRRALGYLLSGILIMASLFIAFDKPWGLAALGVEAWWLWAVWTHPWT